METAALLRLPANARRSVLLVAGQAQHAFRTSGRRASSLHVRGDDPWTVQVVASRGRQNASRHCRQSIELDAGNLGLLAAMRFVGTRRSS
jgi:hypothetical protein